MSNAAQSLRRDARRAHGQAQSRLLADQHWTDGGYGMGKRCPLTVTWHIFNAVHSGELKTAQYKIVETFGLQIPTAVQGTRVPCKLLNPALTWRDRATFKCECVMEISRRRQLAPCCPACHSHGY